MIKLEMVAHAKLNLTLDVVGKRPDGYHDLEMVMQEISLGDVVTLTLGTNKPWSVISQSGEIPCDDSNLAIKAARLFFEATGIDCGGLTVEIEKHTPVCAGMGGGSADGAAVLRLLSDHYGQPLSDSRLYALAEQTGSDVPFALFGGTALAQKKGQVLTRIAPMPDCYIVLCKPPFPISTPELFRAIDAEVIQVRPDTQGMLQALERGELKAVAAQLCNVFAPVVEFGHPEVRDIRETMCRMGALGACMTGSGPTVFGFFEEEEAAVACFESLSQTYAATYLVKPI
jgi:4-diphosphocytidyl-2-C-methyl-D-erythritol kinase